MSSIEIVQRAQSHDSKTAIMEDNRSFTYTELYEQSLRVARFLLADNNDLAGSRVGFIAPPGFSYVAVLWGIWAAGGIAVPLPVMYPKTELDYIVRDCEITTIIAHHSMRDRVPNVKNNILFQKRQVGETNHCHE